jgi:predicted metal-binding membrane protein
MSPIELSRRHDRQMVLAALLMLVALAWAYLVHLASLLPGPDGISMQDMEMAGAAFSGPWSATDFLFAFAMWTTMMVGMMAPTFAPTILLYATLGQIATSKKIFAATAWFAGGYFLAWIAFSLGAATIQTTLGAEMLLTPMQRTAGRVVSGALVVGAGLYQWTPWKNACLAHCRAPLSFIQRRGGFQPRASASLILGLRHGVFCIGCCWALMLLLFLVGSMNLAWTAALAAVLLAEKLWKHGVLVSRIVGTAAIAIGLFLIGQQWL